MGLMDKYQQQYEQTCRAAKQAIENSEQREVLLQELWQGLQLSPVVSELIFRPGNPELLGAAENELLLQVQRLRGDSPKSLAQGVRPLRPVAVRGLII